MSRRERPWTYYDVAVSLCPTCLRKVEGKIVFQDGSVYMDKRCPEHGPVRVLLADDVEYWRRAREVFLKRSEMPQRFQTPVEYGCPYDCGLCADHEQHACLALVEITDRCNLTCPICYADSGPGRGRHRMLDAVVHAEGEPDVVQISGGEPTVHPEFFRILDLARERPIRHLMVNTNGVRIAKDAAREGVILPAQYYPLPDLERGAWPVPPEFALAIARQESELNAAAASPAGARGLMQLMPATAQHVARQIGLPYSETRLVRDPVYNARLGTAYLQRMLDRYDGSYLLATAAYNAGPGRVDAWLQTFGDPRSKGTDVILWIESIPFNETRNYVMRVLESLHVYRARLEGRAGPIRLAAEMNRTG